MLNVTSGSETLSSKICSVQAQVQAQKGRAWIGVGGKGVEEGKGRDGMGGRKAGRVVGSGWGWGASGACGRGRRKVGYGYVGGSVDGWGWASARLMRLGGLVAPPPSSTI